ncbi:hypothetical protein H0H92_014531 [Tricholoma furcatifolium]|nr:hypothetical protein H0H92_014531 [Tricholoma furcatifolium]
MATKAQLEKEKGNAAFKAGDYPNAIGHYTAAILADRADHTFPLNRAAAYLKLGKNEDAERDCTTVLNLNALNAKALFRRGQARLALGKLEEASTDLTQALKREPSNIAIQEELKKVTKQMDKKKAKTSKPSNVPTPTTPAPKRRRVPIKIVDPADSVPATVSSPISAPSKPSPSPAIVPSPVSVNNVDILKPISTRSLNPESPKTTISPSSSQATPITTTAPAPKPEQSRTFKEAKQERENFKPSRVGGGIFRANGESTVFPTREIPSASLTTRPPPEPTPAPRSTGPILPVAPEKPPKTLFDFTRNWDVEHSTAARWGLILASFFSLKLP